MCSEVSLYDVLSVEEDATYDEIRAGYRSSLLKFHPDKSHCCKVGIDNAQEEKFLEAQKAWRVLGDGKSRAQYDRELRLARGSDVVTDFVKIKEMTVEYVGDGMEYKYPCRCGDCFSVTSSDLEHVGLSFEFEESSAETEVDRTPIVLCCNSCSLKIQVMCCSNIHKGSQQQS